MESVREKTTRVLDSFLDEIDNKKVESSPESIPMEVFARAEQALQEVICKDRSPGDLKDMCAEWRQNPATPERLKMLALLFGPNPTYADNTQMTSLALDVFGKNRCAEVLSLCTHTQIGQIAYYAIVRGTDFDHLKQMVIKGTLADDFESLLAKFPKPIRYEAVTLSLSGSKIDPDQLIKLINLLESNAGLYLNAHELTELSAKDLSGIDRMKLGYVLYKMQLPALIILDLEQCFKLTNDCLRTQRFKNLEELNVRSTGLTSLGHGWLPPNLKKLDVRETQIDSEDLERDDNIGVNCQLRHFYHNLYHHFRDQQPLQCAQASILQKCPWLWDVGMNSDSYLRTTTLSLSWKAPVGLSFDELMKALELRRYFDMIDLRNYPSITIDDLYDNRGMKRYPNLKSIDVTGSNITYFELSQRLYLSERLYLSGHRDSVKGFLSYSNHVLADIISTPPNRYSVELNHDPKEANLLSSIESVEFVNAQIKAEELLTLIQKCGHLTEVSLQNCTVTGSIKQLKLSTRSFDEKTLSTLLNAFAPLLNGNLVLGRTSIAASNGLSFPNVRELTVTGDALDGPAIIELINRMPKLETFGLQRDYGHKKFKPFEAGENASQGLTKLTTHDDDLRRQVARGLVLLGHSVQDAHIPGVLAFCTRLVSDLNDFANSEEALETRAFELERDEWVYIESLGKYPADTTRNGLQNLLCTALPSMNDNQLLRAIDTFSQLQVIDVSHCPAVTDASVAKVLQQCSLDSLNLEGCLGITDKAFEGIQKPGDLKIANLLNLQNTAVSERTLHRLWMLSQPRLQIVCGNSAWKFFMPHPSEGLTVATCRGNLDREVDARAILSLGCDELNSRIKKGTLDLSTLSKEACNILIYYAYTGELPYISSDQEETVFELLLESKKLGLPDLAQRLFVWVHGTTSDHNVIARFQWATRHSHEELRSACVRFVKTLGDALPFSDILRAAVYILEEPAAYSTCVAPSAPRKFDFTEGDVEFEFDDATKLKVYKDLVTPQCDYLKHLLTGSFKEKGSPRVHLSECDSNIAEHILRYLYDGMLPKDDVDLVQLLQEAHRWGVVGLVDFAEQWLVKHMSAIIMEDPNGLAGLHELAGTYHLRYLEEKLPKTEETKN